MIHSAPGFMRARACAGLTLRRLTMAGRGQLLDEGFSADFTPGKIHHIEAPNGSGKSSILVCLAGLETVDSGTIEVNPGSVAYTTRDAAFRSWLPPHDDFPLPVSVIDVVLAGRWRFRDVRPPARTDGNLAIATDCLASLGIADLWNRSMDSLSTGQKRRVNLARVFAQDADILLLDEPFSGLDNEARQRVESCLEHIASLGRTVIIARPR